MSRQRNEKGEEERITVADAVRIAVSGKAPFLECLREGVVNYTWLAERIMSEVERLVEKRRVSIDAIKAALIRFQQALQEEGERVRTTVCDVVARSTIELQNDISVVTFRKEAFERKTEQIFRVASEARFFNLNQGKRVYTVVISSENVSPLLSGLDARDVLDRIDDQAAIVMISPYEIVKTPGVVSFITRLLYVNGVNITQLNSSHTDTIIIVPKELSLKAYEVLKRAIEEFRRLKAVGPAVGKQTPA